MWWRTLIVLAAFWVWFGLAYMSYRDPVRAAIGWCEVVDYSAAKAAVATNKPTTTPPIQYGRQSGRIKPEISAFIETEEVRSLGQSNSGRCQIDKASVSGWAAAGMHAQETVRAALAGLGWTFVTAIWAAFLLSPFAAAWWFVKDGIAK